MIQFANKEDLLRCSRYLSFYQFFFFLVKKKLQKGVIEVIGVLHKPEGEVWPIASEK